MIAHSCGKQGCAPLSDAVAETNYSALSLDEMRSDKMSHMNTALNPFLCLCLFLCLHAEILTAVLNFYLPF